LEATPSPAPLGGLTPPPRARPAGSPALAGGSQSQRLRCAGAQLCPSAGRGFEPGSALYRGRRDSWFVRTSLCTGAQLCPCAPPTAFQGLPHFMCSPATPGFPRPVRAACRWATGDGLLRRGAGGRPLRGGRCGPAPSAGKRFRVRWLGVLGLLRFSPYSVARLGLACRSGRRILA
jgi:hypothetical protein